MKRWIGVALLVWAGVTAMIALAPTAEAAGETYKVQDANNIIGTGGAFAQLCPGDTATFKNNNGTYIATCTVVQPRVSFTYKWEISGLTASGGGYNATIKTDTANAEPGNGPITIANPSGIVLAGAAGGGGAGGNADDPPPQCDAGVGTWLVCDHLLLPMINAIDWVRDSIIVPFLEERPLDENDADVKPVKAIWSAFRNVASVFFILVFFLVIFGTAIGWDNYTVKKIMPRLVAGAVLVPFSWYVCVIIIDIGNILGQGIVGLIGPLIPPAQFDFTNPFSALAGTAILGIGAGIAVTSISLGVIFSLFFGMLAVLFTLVMRKILILLLIIISPLAFLAWILPNTARWYKEWWTNLFKLVMMYPIIMMLFEVGRLFAATAGATFGNTANTLEAGAGTIFALVGVTLPLFAVPFAFRFAGKGLSVGQGLVSRGMNLAEKRYGKSSDMAKARTERWRNRMAANAADKSNPMPGKLGAVLGGTRRWMAGTQTGLPGGLTALPSTRAARALQMQKMAASHNDFRGEARGLKEGTKEILAEADRLEKQGKKTGNPQDIKEAQLKRESLQRRGQQDFTYEEAKDKVINRSGLIAGINKGSGIVAEDAKKIRAKGEADLAAAIASGNLEAQEKAKADIARADHIAGSQTTAGKQAYQTAKAKSDLIGNKAAIAAYTEGKAALTKAAKDARDAGNEDLAKRMEQGASDQGKLAYEIDQGKNKMVDDKVAIGAHFQGKADVQATAADLDDASAKAKTKAIDAQARHVRNEATLQTALASGDENAIKAARTNVESSRLEAERLTAEANQAASTASQVRASLSPTTRFSYGIEQGSRRIAGEKAQVAAYNQARSQVAEEAARLEATGEQENIERAKVLRDNLTTQGRMGLQLNQEVQNVVTEQTKLEGLQRANEVSSHDVARQLQAGATVEARAQLDRRIQEERMQEIEIPDPETGGVTKGRVANIDPKGKPVIDYLETQAISSMRAGDQARAAAYLESLTRTSSGREALRRIQYSEEFGGNDTTTIKSEYKDLWERAVSEKVGDKAPDLRMGRQPAFEGMDTQKFLNMDKRAKAAYLKWVQTAKDQYKMEAANAITQASSERLRNRLDDENVQYIMDSNFIQENKALFDKVEDGTKNLDYLSRRRSQFTLGA